MRRTAKDAEARNLAVLTMLRRAAKKGEPCPKALDLSKVCCDTRRTAEWVVGELARKGKIIVESKGGGVRRIGIPTRNGINWTGWTARKFSAEALERREESKRFSKPKCDKPSTVAKRRCLTCGTTFNSFGPGNRICSPCMSAERQRGDNGYHYSLAV